MGNVFTTYERSEYYTKDTCVAKCLYNILVDDPYPNALKDLIRTCDSPKLRLLWEILFETGMDEVALFEERVYQYGSMIKEQDYISREIFMGMITLLEELKKSN